MADESFVFDDAEPMDDMNLQDDMEMASNDEQDDYMEDTGLHRVHDDEEDDFKLDGYDNMGLEVDDDEDDDPGDYDDRIVGKKRKRTSHDDFEDGLTPSRHANARIKAESGEAFILDEETGYMANQQSSRVFGTFGRREREKGETLPAYYKKVSAKLDSDDELMLQMREQGYSDRQISEKLAKDGRVRYDQKSISTRIMRIRLAQAENVDFLLQEGYKEWEFEDDQRLVQAYALADIEISYEIERVRAWRFRKVSEYMRRLNKDSLFSANACRSRYTELISGTARIPTSVDDDPATRRAELEEFRASREALRAKQATEKSTQEALEKSIKEATKIKNAQKAEETANKRAAKELEKAQRAMQRAAQAQLRSQRALENQKAKTERNAQIQKAASVPKTRSKKDNPGMDTTTPAKKSTEPATIDPRSYLSMSDLQSLCAHRGLPTNKPKKELVASLADADMEWTHDQLRKMCKAKGLNAGGNKVVMRYQLALKAAQMCPSFEAGREEAEAEAGEEGEGDEMVVDVEAE